MTGGGIIVWQMPLLHPSRVAGVIGLNTPFMARAPADPIAIMRHRFGDDMYIVHFQKPGEADAALDGDVAKAMGFFMRRPMPETPAATGGLSGNFTARPEDAPPESTFALIKMLQMYDPAVDPRPALLTPDEMAVFVESFERTGFTGRYQLVPQLHAQLGEVGGRRPKGPGAEPDGDGREGRGPAAFGRRRYGSLRNGPGKGADQGLRALDAAGKAGRGEQGHP
jgi:hypothetical protein